MYLTAKSLRYAILTYSCCKQHEIRTNLTHKGDQKNFHSDDELEGLELNLRNSQNQSRARTAGQMASRCASWRKTRIVARWSRHLIPRLEPAVSGSVVLRQVPG